MKFRMLGAAEDPLQILVTLSKRNLLALLSKVDDPNSVKTLMKVSDDGVLLVVKAEPDEAHYGGGIPGLMSAKAEAFIKEYTK